MKARPASAADILGRRPNILVLMCDEMRYPPVYETDEVARFRAEHLTTQELLRRHGMTFERHYAASCACTPSRASLYTGQYPSLHGVAETTGAAKEAFDPDTFWLDPNSVPTLGAYFQAGGYRTHWTGKWHASDADLLVPGTHTAIASYGSAGQPDPDKEALYRAANRLAPFGFDGWIGPEPHGNNPHNSGSSAAPPRKPTPGARSGRDEGFADQAERLLDSLAADPSGQPWLSVVSFVNPHDISLYGMLGALSPGFDFSVDDTVPRRLFDERFEASFREDLATKPTCQKSYEENYRLWMQPIPDPHAYMRLYYQLQKNVDAQMLRVYRALERTGLLDDTIVVFTSDHGDLLGSHGYLHQKWYQAYDEAIRVPLIVSNPRLFPQPVAVDPLTSHVDLLPTLLGLAGLDAEALRAAIAPRYSDALPLVGQDLSPLLLGQAPPAAVDAPIFFMTDDDPSLGLHQQSWTGVEYRSVLQPNHIETVIARLEDGCIWKYSRYFDNPQYWSSPGDPNDPPRGTTVEDVTTRELGKPDGEAGSQLVPFRRTVKTTPVPDEFEMYNVTADPLELSNLAGNPDHAAEQAVLAALLQEQVARKRLTPQSGTVPGQP